MDYRHSSAMCAISMATGWALIGCADQPARLLKGARSPHAWVAEVGADAAVASLAGSLLWCVALWTAVALSVTALALLPGRLGLIAQAVAARLTPAVLRRFVGAAAGTSILLSPAPALANSSAASGPALAAASTSPAPTPAISMPMDRPGAQPDTSAPPAPPSMPAFSWPTDPPSPDSASPDPISPDRATPPHTAGSPHTAGPSRSPGPASGDRPIPARSKPAKPGAPEQGDHVRVRPGDSLWSIVAQRLGATASAASIQREWPRWHAVNRQLIGPDPNLLRPGANLLVPQPANPLVPRPAGLDSGA